MEAKWPNIEAKETYYRGTAILTDRRFAENKRFKTDLV
jgi:hypothetical protein